MRKSLTLIVFIALLGFPGIKAQEISLTDYLAECERKYGNDADLVNGEKYYYPYRQAQGDPFLYSVPRSAMIRIRDKEFSGQQLRYDIYNQKLILDFKDIFGTNSSLVMKNEWVESFAFDDREFVRMEGPDGQQGYFQLVSNGAVSCMYHWSKNYQLNLNSGVQSYYFTEAVKDAYLVLEGKFHPYKSNGSFIKTFDPVVQKTIKQFMKEAKIKVNKAPDSQVRHLVEFCNSLYHEDS